MKIHKLWAENVRGISERLTMELSPIGLNLVTAPNEMGKTTMAEILNYLFQYKASAKSQEIKNLKPYGKDVGPLMGAIIEVNGQIYKIEKQWLKDTKTEVEVISPLKKALSGNAADKEIEMIFTQHLDETIWKMIQVAQANFTSALSNNYNDDQKDMLRQYLGRAVIEDGEDGDESLFERAEKEYLDWWTSTGKQTTAAGSSGKQIAEKTSELRELNAKVIDLAGKIADAISVKEEIVVKRDSREVLQKRKQAQDSNKELVFAMRELKSRHDLSKVAADLSLNSPLLKDFSSELYEKTIDDRALHVQYTALSSIKLTGLGPVELDINGVTLALSKDEIRDQKLESPLKITIPDLLSIEYIQDGSTSASGLAAGSARYIANLKALGCADFAAAQALARQYNEHQVLKEKLETLLGSYTIETLEAAIARIDIVKETLPNWENDILEPAVSVADLEDVAQQVGQKEGRAEEISRFGWHTLLEESREKVNDLEKRLRRLNLSAQAALKLNEVLTAHKSSAEKDYSSHFAKFINDIAKSFYGEEVHFEVSDSFEILSRRMGATEVEIADLSTGAKEQLAILIRLALTQIVQVGESFPVILDDEFAHSDPDRIALMGNVFRDFGDDQQFILLTCYPDKFATYQPAKTIDLALLRGA